MNRRERKILWQFGLAILLAVGVAVWELGVSFLSMISW